MNTMTFWTALVLAALSVSVASADDLSAVTCRADASLELCGFTDMAGGCLSTVDPVQADGVDVKSAEKAVLLACFERLESSISTTEHEPRKASCHISRCDTLEERVALCNKLKSKVCTLCSKDHAACQAFPEPIPTAHQCEDGFQDVSELAAEIAREPAERQKEVKAFFCNILAAELSAPPQ